MEPMPTTPIQIAKYTVQTLIAAKVASLTRDQLIDHTDMNPDGIPVKSIANVTGLVVAGQAAPFTDRAIDKAAERLKQWKQDRKDKKSTPAV